MSIKYRPDIDGLRAVAVLSVLAYHLGFNSFASGGFIGVDVFFVISGYLITKIIYRGLFDGNYSFLEFYQRRVRRIFPALFAVYAGVLVLGFFLRFPEELQNIGETTFASILFSSNIIFYLSSGYFDGGLSTNPLLHTWSLSVEEQFYIIIPVVLFFIRPLGPRKCSYILLSIAIISFIFATLNISRDPNGVFYLVHYRAWELLAGGLLAIFQIPPVRNQVARESISLAGVAAIVLSTKFLTEATPFPGMSAAPAVFGTVAIIYAGTDGRTIVSRLLAWHPIRFLGLISYSLYLWHWPLIVFYSDYFELTTLSRLALGVASIFMAVLSWKFIEGPFRRVSPERSARQTVGVGALSMCVASLCALGAAPLLNFVRPAPVEVERLMGYFDGNYDSAGMMRTGSCFLASDAADFDLFDEKGCLETSDEKPKVLVFGDSHAAHLWWGLSRDLPGYNVLQATAAGCKPIKNQSGREFCTELRDFVLNDFLPTHRMDTIIVSARWVESDAGALTPTLSDLEQYADKVILIGPTPEYSRGLARIIATAVANDIPPRLAASEHRRPEPRIVDAAFKKLNLPAKVTYISAYDQLCRSEECVVELAGNIPMQFDRDHFTREGSSYLAEKIISEMGKPDAH